MASIIDGMDKTNLPTAIEIAALPEHIRGYGHVKEKHLKDVLANKEALFEAFYNPATAEDSVREAAE